MKYRKKPVIIDAIEYLGDNIEELKEFCGDNLKITYYDAAWKAGKGPVIREIYIKTLEGDMKVVPGNMIIRGVQGEYYPCKSDIFKQTYELVVDEI